MAHVAEASEGNGRVLFLLDAAVGDASEAAAAAARFAAAFNAEIEAVSINTDAMERAKDLAVTRIIAANNITDTSHVLARARVQHETLNGRQIKAVAEAARRASVAYFHTTVSGVAVEQLDQLCLSRGPWNVVVLARSAGEHTAEEVSELFANVSGATGIVTVPSRSPHPAGPVAVVVEDAERLPAMLRAAGRLKGLCGRVHLLLAADARAAMEELETQVRLITSSYKGLVIEQPWPLLGVPGALDETLRGLKTSFVVARFGGVLLPGARRLARTVAIAAAPFLLVR